MKAVLFTKRNTVRLADLPDPVPGPGEVVVDVRASGICHTDYEVLKANYGTSAFPVVPGHEYAGVIREAGPGVEGIAVGARVVVDPNLECGACRACGRGWAHLCENLGAYGVTTHGGFAEASVVKASAVHPIGDMDFSDAALAEPMGCVLNGLDAAYRPWMETALIIGAGPMGLLMGMALRARGVGDIAFCDISESRLALAERFGFASVASGSDTLKRWHHAGDLVVDATGVPAVAATLPEYVANGGVGLFFGVCPADARIEISPFEIFRRQLSLVGSHSLNHNIPQAIEVLSALGPQVAEVVSHRLSLREIGDVLASAPPEGSLKMQFIA